MREPVERDYNRFSRFAPEEIAVIPPGYSAPLDMRTSREIEAERLQAYAREQEALAHWTHRVPAWLERTLKAWFYRP